MTEEEKRYIDRQNECKVIYEQQMKDYRKLTGEPAPTSMKSKKSGNNSVEQLSKLNRHNDQSHNSESPVYLTQSGAEHDRRVHRPINLQHEDAASSSQTIEQLHDGQQSAE